MTTRQDFALALLDFGQWVPTQEHIIGIVAWGSAENSEAENNMLDTTEPAPGATDYNSVGVKNYPSLQVGIEATYATLRNGYYPGVLAVLEDEGSSAMSLAAAVGNSPWGTGNFSKMVENVKADPAPYMDHVVPGGGPAPNPLPPTPPQMEDMMSLAIAPDGSVYAVDHDGDLQHFLDPAAPTPKEVINVSAAIRINTGTTNPPPLAP